MKIAERVKRIEKKIREARESLYAGNEDGFITALGVNEEDFETTGGGYDVMAALNAVAAEDWKDWDGGDARNE
jgi:hypothetical protein